MSFRPDHQIRPGVSEPFDPPFTFERDEAKK